MTPATKRMIKKYGKQACINAYNYYDDGRNCAASCAEHAVNKWNTNTGDGLINAGRDILDKPL